MDDERPPAPADGGAPSGSAIADDRKALAETAAILLVFSFALALLAILALLALPFIEARPAVAIALSVAGMVCASFSRERRFQAAQTSSAAVATAFVVNLLILLLALAMQFVLSALRM